MPKSGPLGIAPGPDGNVWFVEITGHRIGRITPSGTISEFPIPTPESFPNTITPGPDGNLWFTMGANKIGRITPSGAISAFTAPTSGGSPLGITAGPQRDLWFTDTNNSIGRITPSGKVSQFPLPTEEVSPQAITAGPRGTLWLTELYGNAIVRVEPRLLEGCVVPTLLGKALARAKQLLRRAHCGLGIVANPFKLKGKLVVVVQRPAPKTVLPAGTKVSMRLG
jgi:streptogramin lyase